MKDNLQKNKKGGKRVAPRGSVPGSAAAHRSGTHLEAPAGAHAAADRQAADRQAGNRQAGSRQAGSRQAGSRQRAGRQPAGGAQQQTPSTVRGSFGALRAGISAAWARISAAWARISAAWARISAQKSAKVQSASEESALLRGAQQLHDGVAAALDFCLQMVRIFHKHARILRRQLRHAVHEKRARRFPESNRTVIQMVLFAWGMLPMLGGKLRERSWGMRKRLVNFYAHISTRDERKRVHPAVFLGSAATIAVVVLFSSLYTYATTVQYDGTPIASVGSKETAVEALSRLEQVTAQTLGETATFDKSRICYSSGFVDRAAIVDEDTFEQELSSEIGLVTHAYALYVDGELIGATPYEGALEELLQQIQDACMTADTVSCKINEKTEIRPEYVPTEKVMNLGYIAEILNDTKAGEVDYTVISGDTWSEIAEKNNMTSVELLAMNPGYNIDKIAIGEVLTISNAVPYLSVTLTERQRYVEDVPYEIEYQDSAALYQGDYKTLKKGTYGSADVVADVTTVNGEETQRDILSSVRLTNPTTEIQARGTKVRPTWVATGNFRWPCSGHVTSRFGYRNLSYSRASKNHKGIDIANSYGTAVSAADGGTVAYAGWMSGYGYLVQINHGNGYVTYYGHNSRILVSAGDHVYKGQQVARMGSTGNSTGNHCHFEVRYKGTPKNPMQYLG